MDLLNGMPRAARPTWPEGTREQIQMLFFDDLIAAESHYLTIDSEVMQRREIPSAYYLMRSFPRACIFFYISSERLYRIPECVCEWDQLEETEWNPQNPTYFADDLSKFPDVLNEGVPHTSPSNVDTRLVEVLNESKTCSKNTRSTSKCTSHWMTKDRSGLRGEQSRIQNSSLVLILPSVSLP